MINIEKQYRVEQVATLLGVSSQTINLWYAWKRTNPKSENVKLLPEYTQATSRSTRYWTREDIKQLRKFKKSIIKGRDGVMAVATQRYRKRKDKDK